MVRCQNASDREWEIRWYLCERRVSRDFELDGWQLPYCPAANLVLPFTVDVPVRELNFIDASPKK